jgi:hypothetical protein
MIKITGTFIDEITYDIPSQNWDEDEWDRDFQAMKEIGIDTVIIIRAGLRDRCIFSSKVLKVEVEEDLAKLFLEKSEKYGMKLFFGLYDSSYYWIRGDWQQEVEINLKIIDEIWAKYSNYRSFYGWYFVHEIGRNEFNISEIYNRLGEKCKRLDEKKPILISPFFYGRKISEKDFLTPYEHQCQWDKLLSSFKYIDIAAFQDGTVLITELSDYWKATKEVFDHYKVKLWANVETFTRDMPIKFPPIDIRELITKLRIAEHYVEKAITFEFSHFMSPNSVYLSARNLYKRYKNLVLGL